MPRTRRALAPVSLNNANADDVTAKTPAKTVRIKDVKTSENASGKRKVEKLSAENEELRVELANQRMELEKSTAEVQKATAENEELKAQIEELSNLMSKSSLESDEKAPATATINPFGGTLRAAITQPIFAPKRPKSAFQFFGAEFRADVKEEYPDMSLQEVNAYLKELWQERGDEENDEYFNMEVEDRTRYEKEKLEYEKKKSEAERTRLAVDYVNEERKKELAMKFYEDHLEELAKKEESKPRREEIPKPKQPRSEWNCFQKHHHAELRKTTKGKRMTFAEITSHTATAWRNLQSSTKKADTLLKHQIQTHAKMDKQRYDDEMAVYNARIAERRAKAESEAKEAEQMAIEIFSKKEKQEELLNEGRKAQAEKERTVKEQQKLEREEKKAARLAKAAQPKKPRSAYNYFVQKNLPVVQSEDGVSGREAMSKLSALWKSLESESKAEYEEMAEADKARYEAEKANFDKNSSA